MSSLKACIFDLDGVIVDTAKYHYLAWKDLANSLNINFTLEDNEKLKGVSRMESLDIILSLGNVSLTNDEKIKLAFEKNKIYCKFLDKMSEDEMLAGAKELLIDLRKNNILIALGSASKNALTILNKLNITNLFDTIIDGNKVSKAKPNPEVFILGANNLNVQYTDCIVFEDSIAGIKAAKSINMKTIGIGTKENLPLADKIYTDLSTLNYLNLKTLFE